MKIECDKSKIEPLLQKAAKLTGKHLTLPVLSCLYLEAAKDNKLIIKSTNLDIGVEIEAKIKTLEAGFVTVPAGVLISLLASIKDNNLTLETKDDNLLITSNKNSSVLKCMPSDDFPSIPRLSNSDHQPIKIKSKDLINGFKSVWYSASNSNIKPELSSVYIYKEDSNLVFVSTDSFRLAEKKINVKISNDFPATLIPYKNVVEIIRLFEDFNEEIEIIFEKNQAAFIIPDMYLVSRLIDGSFPDYKQIMPKQFITTATVLKEDLIDSIKTSNIFSDSFNQIKIKTDFKNKSLQIESKNNEVGESKEALSANLSGENLELSFNSRYIMDCMPSIPSSSINLNFSGVGRSLVIEGASDKSFMYIVMPMNR